MTEHDARAAITDVLARYAVALDGRDFVAVGECFTSDAQATFSGVTLAPGRAAIVRHVSGLGSMPASTHLLGLPVIEIDRDGDAARAATPAVAFLVTSESGPLLTRGIFYDDDFVCADGRWLIARRVHRVDWMYETVCSPPATHRDR